MDLLWQAVVSNDYDSHHIESKQGEVGQVVMGECFLSQMSVYAPEPPKTTGRKAILPEVGDDDSPGIAHDHEGDMTLAVDQKADLAPNFRREPGEVPGEFTGYQKFDGGSTIVQIFKPLDMAGFQTKSVSEKSFHRKK